MISRYLLVRGDHAWERGDIEEADRHYADALAAGEGLASVVGQIGQRHVDQSRPERAVEVYEGAVADLEDPVLHTRLGAIYGREGRLDEAEEQFQRALELQPALAEAHANLASVYGRRGEIDRAVAELEIALQHDPNSILALKNLGTAYANLGRPDEARDLLQRALAINPLDDEVRTRLDAIGGAASGRGGVSR
jgi:tetratricopeptide (TPR) repeat protein